MSLAAGRRQAGLLGLGLLLAVAPVLAGTAGAPTAGAPPLKVLRYAFPAADIKSRLRRMAPSDDPDGYNAVFGDLVALEAYRRSLLEQAVDPIVDAG